MRGKVTIVGREAQSGAYLLRILAAKRMAVQFGRFRGGEAIALPAGEYVYVGSAMGEKGASCLARRLVRHATRRETAPHEIRELMLAEFARLGLGHGDLQPRGAKGLFWHVDYLLEATEVSLTHVLVLRSGRRLEKELAALVAGQPYTSTPAPGLGASDAAGDTHLFAVRGERQGWWEALAAAVRALDDSLLTGQQG
mgnify:CR=1 FL=1